MSYALSALVVLGAAVAISVDPLIGLVLGLAISAMIVAASRAFGVWTELSFLPTAIACLAAMATPWLAAQLGLRVRRATRVDLGWAGNTPAVGSLGLIDSAMGEALLGDEILRAHRTKSPLSLLRVVIRFRPTGTAQDRIQACRAVTRVLDGTLRAIDVSYAYADNNLSVILPGTDGSGARLLGGRIGSALATATVRNAGRERQPLSDFAMVTIGSAEYSLVGSTISTLVDEADPDGAGSPTFVHGNGLMDAPGPRAVDPRPAVQIHPPLAAGRLERWSIVRRLAENRPWRAASSTPEDATVVSSAS